MKRLPLIAVFVLTLLAGAIVARFVDHGWHTDAASTVAAPPSIIHGLLDTRGGWLQLQKLLHRDDATFAPGGGGDPDRGVGMVVTWKGADGERTLTLTALEAERIAYTVVVAGVAEPIEGELRLTPEGAGTALSWTEAGPLPGGVWGALTSPPDAERLNAAHAQKFEVLRGLLEAYAKEAAILEGLANPGG